MFNLIRNSKKKWLASFALITSFGVVAASISFSENFLSDTSIDTAKTTANFSTEEQAVYLTWSKQQQHRLPDGDTSGTDIGSEDDYSHSIALADIDGDGDIDVVVGNEDATNKLYLNDGSGGFPNIGTDIGNNDADKTFSIAVADIDGDGDIDVVAGNSGQSNKLYLNDGSGGFDATGTAIGSELDYTLSVALGDIDGDGYIDLVTGNANQTNKLYLNNRSGGFTTGSGADIGSALGATSSIALGDIDGDGDFDVVAGNNNQINKLYLNNDGGFAANDAGTPIGSDADDTRAIALADIDGDGKIDLVGGFGGGTKRYLNNGNGGFSSTGTVIGSPTQVVYGFAFADVDNDGDMDLAVAPYGGQNKLMLNDGNGGFPSESEDVGSESGIGRSIDFADIDGDGVIDLVAGNWQATTKVYFQASKRDFSDTGIAISSDTNDSHNFAWGDVDNDSELDLVVANHGLNKLYLNDGKGGFATATNIGSETDTSEDAILVDIDADGDLDLVVGNQNQTNKVYTNDGTGSFSATGTAIGSETDNTRAIALGDLDGDGYIDLVVGNQGQANKVYLNDGRGSFGTSANIDTDTDETYDIALVDINGDGHLDAVAGNYLQTTKVYLNGGNAVFAAGSDLNTDAGSTQRVVFADLDNDGDMDLVAGNDGDVNKFYLNDGSGNFPASGTDLGSESDDRLGLALADMDNDGDIDVVASNYNETNKLYLNDGTGSFSATGTAIGSETDNTTAIALVDYDGDGDIDVLSANSNQTNKLYLNNGDAYLNFTNDGIAFGSTTSNSLSAAYGDVDNDGDIDLVVGNQSQTNQLYLNNGNGGFSATGTDIGNEADQTYSIALADVDNDGDLDVIAGNYHETTKLYLNDGTGGFSATGTDIGTETDATTAIAIGDVNKDGYIDIVIGNALSTENKLYLNDGSGGFSVTGINIGSETENTFSIALQDINKDGKLDIVVGNDNAINKLYLNNGSGGFPATGANIGSETDDTASLAFADIDNNGYIDILAGNYTEVSKLYLNNSLGAFPTAPTNIDSGLSSTRAIIFADVDKDGDQDILISNNSQTDKIYYNNGLGAFSTTGAEITSAADNTRAMLWVDIDNNGNPDLIAVNNGLVNKLYRLRSHNIHGHQVYSNKINGSVIEVVDVTLTASATTNTETTRNTSIDYYVSNNGGDKWNSVKSGVNFTFPEAGTDDIRWRAQLNSLSPTVTPVISNVELSYTALPKITGVAYNIFDAELTVTGINFASQTGATNDMDASMFAFTGEASGSYTLTDSVDVDITSSTEFTLSLSVTDKAAVNALINKNGTASTDGTVYNLAAAEDWNAGAKTSLIIANSTTAITANNINEAPAISGAPAVTVAEDASYSFTPTVTDVNTGDTKTFSITNKPSWASFSTTTGALTGTPTNDDVGTTTGIVITVTDSEGLSASLAAFDIEVTNTNDAPTISGTPATTAVQGMNYSFPPTAVDVDAGDTITFGITNRPSWASFSTTTGELTGKPTNSDVGTLSKAIFITVTDSAGANASLPSFTITVTNTNDAPTISGTPATTVSEGATYSFTPTVTDVDAGDTKTFSITNKPSWALFSTTTGALTGTPTNDDVGTTAGIVITVTDSAGASASLSAFNLEVVTTNTTDVYAVVNDTATTDDRTAIQIDILANDINVDSHTLRILSATAEQGSVVINSNILTYTPLTGFDGIDTITYVIDDGNGNQINGLVSVTIEAYQVIEKTTAEGGSLNPLYLLFGLILVLLKRIKVSSKLIPTVFVLVSTSAYTETSEKLSASTIDYRLGWYLGGELGYATTDVSKDDFDLFYQNTNLEANALSLDDSDFTQSLFVGYQFNHFWALEAGYLNLGSRGVTFEGTALDIQTFYDNSASIYPQSGRGFIANVIAQYPITDQFNVAARLGLFNWTGDYELENNSQTVGSDKNKGTDLWYGAELNYRLSQSLQVYFSASQYQMERDNNNVAALGARYYFGSSQQPRGNVQPEKKVAVTAPVDTDKDGVLDSDDNCENTSVLYQVDINGCTLTEEKVSNFNLVIYFSRHSSEISSTYDDKLQGLVDFIKQYNVQKLNIYGYASAPGPKSYNLKLSQQRAQSIADVLQEKFKINKDIIIPVGRGEEMLIDNGNTQEAHQLNRRVELNVEDISIEAVKRVN